MSDEGSPVADEKKKRGRQPKTDKNAVKEPKKRGRSTADKKKSDGEEDGGAAPAKRGRGRPKGSHKKKVKYLFFFFLLEDVPNISICISKIKVSFEWKSNFDFQLSARGESLIDGT